MKRPPLMETEVDPYVAGDETPEPFVGSWRITDMEVWGREYIDLVVPGHVTFGEESMGEFQFGTVCGWLDCHFGERDGKPLTEFSGEGENDRDTGCGRGWAVLAGDTLEGRLFIHRGDDSAFNAKRSKAMLKSKPMPMKRRR